MNRFVDEGLRVAMHPGVVFKDGPSGRRAALVLGPDVWEVVKFPREIDERGSDAIAAAVEMLRLSAAQVGIATRHYSAYPDEIDDEVAQADGESVAAEDWPRPA
jgi:hypothetical protein